MSILRNRRLLAGASALAALIVAVAGYRHFTSNEAPPHLTASVERADLEDAVLAVGTLYAHRQVDVGAQVSGQLKSLKVQLGDPVREGQVLAEIDPTLLEHALGQAQAAARSLLAQRAATDARLRQAALALERERQLWAREATSREALERAEAQWQVERADLSELDARCNGARIEVDKARANAGYTRIVAPMSGHVVAIVTRQGQTVIAEQQAPVILKLADLDTMTVKAQVSEADVLRVEPGERVHFTVLGDPDTRYEGTVRAIEPAPQDFAEPSPTGGGGSSAGGSSRGGAAVFYNALFEVPNPEHRLRISMTAQVSIVQGAAKGTLVVPASALGAKGADGAVAVRVLTGDGRVDTRQVRIGMNNQVKAQVLEGLSEGERVIVGQAPADDTAGHAGEEG
ncbi:efflux transporter periplasmic adaptor subunit [Trinickia dabaoshanensis]|uniref:Efflux transporter periplasmic adaptor subunit n=1 Tax=Trinickia dabaoshanensis TaxID=564714 RepID=A0A2N7VGX4_9BURK|nr:efflux RND transporter periplasmic adaptor subunit [Trinickia dabaoshanensis]PMS16396.1 efflux transporter periplasmic adaptor subunit [Trinickia dabaoshanensis]